MPPKKQNDAPANNRDIADWTELRQTLVAMQENIQTTIQTTMLEMGDMLAQRHAGQFPIHNEDEDDDFEDVRVNPFAGLGPIGEQR